MPGTRRRTRRAITWSAAVHAVLVLVTLIVAPRRREPGSAIAWILLVALFPVVGFLLFALIGGSKLPAARRHAQRASSERIAEIVRALPPERLAVPDRVAGVVRMNRALGAFPMLPGNRVDLVPHFPEQLGVLVDAVDAATARLDVEFYILALDPTTRPLFDALARAVQRGVRVRLMLDHLGSAGYPGFRPALRELARIGVETRLMLPVQPWRGRWQRPDLRNHRKLMVVDERVAFLGSLNLIDPGYERASNARRGLRWRDLLVRLEGPVVQEVAAVFDTDWFSETGEAPAEPVALADAAGGALCQIAPSGPAFPYANNLALFVELIHGAECRVSITSPYFVPDEALVVALLSAAARGVAVELFVGAIGDQFAVFHAQHSYYRSLLDAGVRIRRFPAPQILHAKHVSIDDDLCVIGSSNLDIRSFQLDLEVSLFAVDADLCGRLREVEDEYRAVSNELTDAEWARTGRLHGVVDSLARLTSALQ